MGVDASSTSNEGVALRGDQLVTTGGRGDSERSGGTDLVNLGFVQIFNAVKRKKLLILIFALLGLLAGFLIALASPKIYQASAQIEVNPENLRAVEIEGQPVQSTAIDETFLLTQLELLRTRVLRERVVRKLRLDTEISGDAAAVTPAARMESSIARLGGSVSTSQLRNTRLFQIDVEDTDPERAARIANTYADEFIALNIERQLDVSSFARTYLAEQIADTRKNLESSERALVEYARDQRIVSLSSPTDEGNSPESLAVRSLADVNTALINARVKRINLQERMRFEAAKPDNLAERNALQAQLAELRSEYQQKAELFKPEYPEMVALQQRIRSLETSLAGVRTQGRRENMQAMQSEYNAALGEERQLQAQLAELEASALSERGNSIQYNILKRDVQTNAAQYDALLERFKQIGTAATQVQNLISVVEPATRPNHPIRPNMAVNLALGLFAGLALGLIVAILTSLLSGKIRTLENIEQLLDEKALGAIPKGDFENIVTELRDPKTDTYEAFMSLANRMRFATDRGFPKLMSLTSTLPNEGKSSTSYGLAHVLSRQGRSVVVIDADLRMPTFLGLERSNIVPGLVEQIKANKGRGLTEVLIGEEQVDTMLVQLNERLMLLPSGETPPNPAELLSSQQWSDLVRNLAARFDHVIVDTPPVLGLADAPVVASQVDATLFVVQSDRALSQQIKTAIRRLRDNNAKVIGVVLMQASAEESDDAYGYSYNYSYGGNAAEETGLRRWLKMLRR